MNDKTENLPLAPADSANDSASEQTKNEACTPNLSGDKIRASVIRVLSHVARTLDKPKGDDDVAIFDALKKSDMISSRQTGTFAGKPLFARSLTGDGWLLLARLSSEEAASRPLAVAWQWLLSTGFGTVLGWVLGLLSSMFF